jgi:hypothetical protein
MKKMLLHCYLCEGYGVWSYFALLPCKGIIMKLFIKNVFSIFSYLAIALAGLAQWAPTLVDLFVQSIITMFTADDDEEQPEGKANTNTKPAAIRKPRAKKPAA